MGKGKRTGETDGQMDMDFANFLQAKLEKVRDDEDIEIDEEEMSTFEDRLRQSLEALAAERQNSPREGYTETEERDTPKAPRSTMIERLAEDAGRPHSRGVGLCFG